MPGVKKSQKPMRDEMNIIDVNQENVDLTGFFCNMSKKKSEGYQRKLRWIKSRFAEGMKIKMLNLSQGGRGFIEYMPGECAWRAVNAKGYMLIHCLWVVGKSKGKGYGSILLNECIEDARQLNMKGVAMVTSEGTWLAGKKLLERHGFESVDQAPPSFDLMVKKFGNAHSPSFIGGWDTKIKKCSKGLVIFRSDQCPYLDDAVNILMESAIERGIKGRVVDLKDCQSVRELAPTAYGVFNIVYNGELLSYHYLTKREFIKRLDDIEK